ncbi:hypothetical protein ABW21_db0201299 [Orbilia brochopaga]|nr:hypothetical protein ABW21_db0201299 [Drechslerella brochopaga]
MSPHPAADAPVATNAEMSDARLPLAYRDRCAGLLDERHSYERCQYDEFMKRVKKMEELKAANPAMRSN